VKPDSQILLNNSGQYDSLRQQILRRDGWRCQSCGTMSNLDVHHREFRSHLEPTPRECGKKTGPQLSGRCVGNRQLFVLNDQGYASIRATQQNYFGGANIGCDSNTGLSIPNYRKVARAYDLKTAVT